MKANPRKFGSADRQLLPEGRLTGPMPWVLAIMMFLTVLAAAAGLGLGNAARSLNANIVNEAALAAGRRGAANVGQRDFEEAVDRIQLGLKKHGKVMGEEEKRSEEHKAELQLRQ